MKYLSLLLFVLMAGCGEVSNQEEAENWIFSKYKDVTKNVTINDEVVQRYCKTYAKLREKGPEFLKYANEDGQGQAGFDDFEGTVKEGGFKDYADFVATNARIGWAMNMSQGQIGMEVFSNLHNKSVVFILAVINHPVVPEETKNQLREKLKEMKAQWKNDKKWADYTMDKLKPLMNDADIAVIKRNMPCLMESYTGISYDDMLKTSYYQMQDPEMQFPGMKETIEALDELHKTKMEMEGGM